MMPGSPDLRSFIAELKHQHAREIITIADELSGDWELAALTTSLEKKLRMPVIHYTRVRNSEFSVMHNVCASLSRIARVMKISVTELESRLAAAYETLIPPVTVDEGPVRENSQLGDAVNLYRLPLIRYTQYETHPYISAACVVARDSNSGALNLSFHRLMIHDRNSLAIYLTPGGDLHQIYESNRAAKRDTPVAAFIGAHPLWSLGSLSAGPLSMDEYSFIGGLMGTALSVVRGLHDAGLRVPAAAEFSIEGHISYHRQVREGPYGEAFGYTSQASSRPLMIVQSVSHRHEAIFQDIVPGRIEHLTMTSVSIRVHLQKTLPERFSWVKAVHLPAPMMLYLSVDNGTAASDIHTMLRNILIEQRFIKYAVAFADEVKLDSPKETQQALAIHTQVGRDTVVIHDLPGNGLDPSERNGLTTKCGIDCTSNAESIDQIQRNVIPRSILDRLDVEAIIKRASITP